MGTESSSQRAARRWAAVAVLGCCVSLSCHGSQPASERAPSPAPVTAPEAAPEPPPPPAAPAPASAPLLELKKDEAPASSGAPAEQSLGGAGRARSSSPAAATRKAVPKKAKGGMVRPEAADDRLENERDEGEPPGAPAELRQRLDRAYRASSPDCPSARDRKKAVCDLATQICQLTDRDPNVASVAEYCDEARRRCSDAERRTVERCPE